GLCGTKRQELAYPVGYHHVAGRPGPLLAGGGGGRLYSGTLSEGDVWVFHDEFPAAFSDGPAGAGPAVSTPDGTRESHGDVLERRWDGDGDRRRAGSCAGSKDRSDGRRSFGCRDARGSGHGGGGGGSAAGAAGVRGGAEEGCGRAPAALQSAPVPVSAIEDLTTELARLPGIGRKPALRLTYYLLKRPPEEARRLARVLERAPAQVLPCSTGGNPTETDPCALCSNPRRDGSSICVVEEAADIGPIERTGEYRGLYHVLGGRISPLEGIGPDELNVQGLLGRLADGGVREVIVATNPSVEGEATALYLQKVIRPLGVRVTRLARGLPVGGDLEYADGVTIAEALSGRREL